MPQVLLHTVWMNPSFYPGFGFKTSIECSWNLIGSLMHWLTNWSKEAAAASQRLADSQVPEVPADGSLKVPTAAPAAGSLQVSADAPAAGSLQVSADVPAEGSPKVLAAVVGAPAAAGQAAAAAAFEKAPVDGGGQNHGMVTSFKIYIFNLGSCHLHQIL